MRIARQRTDQAVALIIVMVVVLVLGILAGGFSYTMKVETRLASNTQLEPDLQWLGRSGVEMARYLVGQQLALGRGSQATALNQKWAGGEGNTNDYLAWISLENNELGEGRFSIKITDAERKFNINLVPSNPAVMQQALVMLGVDLTESATIVDALLDWIDADDHSHLNGAESTDYYLRLDPPYYAKNGPITDLSELALVKGITPELLYGAHSTNAAESSGGSAQRGVNSAFYGVSSFSGGLVDLFTTVGGPQVNINTATTEVLQMIGFPIDVAASIVTERAGFDGVPGTQDDHVFTSPAELARWLPPPANQFVSRLCTSQSQFFEVQVDAWVGQYQRRYHALLKRNSPADVPVLFFYGE